MRVFLVLLVVLSALACGKTKPPTQPVAVEVESKFVKVSGKQERWSLEIPRSWEVYPTESEGAWRNKEKNNSIVANSQPYTGNPVELYMDILETLQSNDEIQVLKAAKVKIQGRDGAAFAIAGKGAFLVQFVVATDTHAYTLICVTTPAALEQLMPVCDHAVATWQMK